MNEYSLQLAKQARTDLEQLPVKIQKQIARDLETLTAKPFPEGIRIKKLKGFSFPLYRLRTGDFRVLYRIDGRLITLLRVIDRKILDRILARLK